MHDDATGPQATVAEMRLDVIEFDDGWLVFDRNQPSRWLHTEDTVSLDAMR